MAAKANKKKVTQKKVVTKKVTEKPSKESIEKPVVAEVEIPQVVEEKVEKEKVEETEKEVEGKKEEVEVKTEALEEFQIETKKQLDINPVDSILEELTKAGVEIPTEPAPPTELSPLAKKWKAYLNLQRQTPEEFLKKYEKTNHKFLHIIKEIIEFEKK